MNFRKLNIATGWLVFLIATIVYFLTLEPTVSLWDCGEYIMAAFKLEVGHPPGAPLFMLLGRLFTFFVSDLTEVAVWINRMSALSSSFTILFMFWSITLLVKKMVLQNKENLSSGDIIAIIGSGAVGALAYTFSDTFWFSAVEGEVYAMSSLFTAIVFWAILKWDEEMALLQQGNLNLENDAAPNRWLLLIFFLIGLAIGVHLLGILLIPAIGYVIYFRYWKEVNPKTFIIVGIVSVLVLAIIQAIVIPGTVSMASSFEITFRNSFGLPFLSGTIFFFVVLITALVYTLKYARKKGKTILYNSVFALIFLLIGYGSFMVIVIRSNANTPMDQNNPENLVNLHSYLQRDQYGKAPLLSGPFWNSKEMGGRFNGEGKWNAYADRSEWADRAPVYVRRFIVTDGASVLKTFLKEKDANDYAKVNHAEVQEKFFEVNSETRIKAEPTYSQTTLFPRMYSDLEPRKVQGYKNWSGYDATRLDGEIGKDGLPLPTFSENITYFFRYQVNWMYFRYFMWNFAGRQNDIQGDGNQMIGNWKSGFSFLDSPRLGNQKAAPYYTTHNKSNNSFFFIPLILGLIGLFYHAYKSPKDAFIVFMGFLLTGLAIVIYLNQKVYEPRERDYAYAGSFYFFAIWIGLGVYALYQTFLSFSKELLKKIGFAALAGLVVFLIIDIGGDGTMSNTKSWFTLSIIAIALLVGMNLLRKVLKSDSAGATVSLTIGLIAPILMGTQGWDDHNRSGKTTAHDVAYNYMNAVSPNGIIFTSGDNDTFPLWYIQEVEKFRSDVRVCNLSLMQTDWYTAQMMRKTYGSDPLPIKFTPDQVLMYSGGTDNMQFIDLTNVYFSNGVSAEITKKIIALRLKANKNQAIQAVNKFAARMNSAIGSFQISIPTVQNRVNQLKTVLLRPAQLDQLTDDIHLRFSAMIELFGAFQNGSIKASNETISSVQTALSELSGGWESMYLKDAMAFARDDKNMLSNNGHYLRFFPTNQFILKVNKEAVIKSGVVPKNTSLSSMKDAYTFTIEAGSLTREEIMMLDVLANNDWKRGIYFSSPYGSEVSSALLKAKMIKQTGSAFEVNPIDQDAPIAEEEMYANLMQNQHYGAMSNPDVLTDYYARRQVSQFRNQFAALARLYLNKIQQVNQAKNLPDSYINMLPKNAASNESDIAYMHNHADQLLKKYKSRVIDILDRAEEVMPIDIVLDGGEPRVAGTFRYQGAPFPKYVDGLTADFVQFYFDVDSHEKANQLGQKIAKQQQQTIEFFLNAPTHIIASEGNQPHFYVALDNYFQLMTASNEVDGNPAGELAKTTKQYTNQLLTDLLPKMYRRIEADLDPTQLGPIKTYIDALITQYGLGANQQIETEDPNLDIDQMIKEQLKADSVVE